MALCWIRNNFRDCFLYVRGGSSPLPGMFRPFPFGDRSSDFFLRYDSLVRDYLLLDNLYFYEVWELTLLLTPCYSFFKIQALLR